MLLKVEGFFLCTFVDKQTKEKEVNYFPSLRG